MFDINIPLWLLFTVAGLPALLTAGIFYREIRKSGQKSAVPFAGAPEFVLHPESFGGHVQQQLIEQHVDGIFTALSITLEAERNKFKTLLNHSVCFAPADTAASSAAKSVSAPLCVEEKRPLDMPIGQKISVLTTRGMSADQIAHDLGISQTEVALALKMKEHRGFSRSLNC
jgi:hypothetical protein